MMMTILLIGCGEIKIQPTPEGVSDLSSDSLFCAIPPKEIGRYTNILFIIDQSGSNRYGQDGSSPGTDPSKQRRGDALRNFLNEHRNNEYIKWGFIAFNGDFGARAYIRQASGSYFGTASDMDAALTTFQNTLDNNGTPYEEALNLTRSAVEQEISLDQASTNANYALVFISDGRPAPVITPENRLFEMIEAMTSLADGGVRLSTVYYNNNSPDPEDRARLEEMARVGRGKYQDASQGQTDINIDELIVGGVYYEPYTLADLFVYNLNASSCDDGAIGLDSDADGLCDRDEESYNQTYTTLIDQDVTTRGKRFQINSRNSFLSNFSDAFFLRKLRGERLPDCNDPARELTVDMLNSCEKRFFTSPNPIGPTPEWTDDLYQNGKKAMEHYFDSDGDNILDGLEFFFFKDKGAPLNYYSQYSKTNGTEYRELFRNHQHPLRPQSSRAYAPRLTFVKRNEEGIPCYHFNQESLSLYKTKAVDQNHSSNWASLAHQEGENVILVYYVLKTEYSPNGKGVLKYSYQRKQFGGPNETVDLANARFEAFTPEDN